MLMTSIWLILKLINYIIKIINKKVKIIGTGELRHYNVQYEKCVVVF